MFGTNTRRATIYRYQRHKGGSMREIRFRAWDEEAEEYSYSGAQSDFYAWGFDNDILKLENDLRCWALDEREPTMDDPDHIELRELHDVEQYTGLKDKNGVEIYEGDILLHDIMGNGLEHNPKEALTVIVSYKYASFGYLHTHPELNHESDREWTSFWDSEDRVMWDLDSFEVIGNIHENPEILNA